EQQLIEREIEPAAELVAGLADGAGMNKAELFVEPHARAIGSVDAADDRVVLLLARCGDQLLQQRRADTLAAMLAVHVDRVLDRVLVRRPGAEAAITGESDQLVIGNGADDREAPALLALEPA